MNTNSHMRSYARIEVTSFAVSDSIVNVKGKSLHFREIFGFNDEGQTVATLTIRADWERFKVRGHAISLFSHLMGKDENAWFFNPYDGFPMRA